ncbi:MAG TPA: hypothetical protein VGO57_14075 [Verrucomicrobiae bacterium]|jgi:Tfp pilus assembly protein PilO
MKKYLAHLRPMERRLVIGVAVLIFLVLNAWKVWPHFSDWGELDQRLNSARIKLKLYQTATMQIPALKTKVDAFGSEGAFVAPEDQSINLMRTINAQAAASGVLVQGFSPHPLTLTNDAFFVEQVQNITVVATETQLVDFLYKLGSSTSMIRVRDLALRPDSPHYHLTADIKLVASYQKNSTPAKAAGKPAAPAVPPKAPAMAAPAAKANFLSTSNAPPIHSFHS